jgi:hypothetical protein
MASLFPNQDQNGTIIGPNVWSSVTMGLGDLMLSGEPLEIFESNGYIVIKAVGSNGKILLIDPETGLVMDLLIGNETSCGSYCYKNQQAEWAEDVVESILDYGQNIMNILINGDGTIDLSQLAANTKNGLIGFLGSTMISLEGAELFLDAISKNPSSLLSLLPLLGNNIIGLCLAGSIITYEIADNAGFTRYVADPPAFINRIMDEINNSVIVNYTPSAVYHYVSLKINWYLFGTDNSYQKSTYSQLNGYIRNWANVIKENNPQANTNYEKGEAVFNYVFNNIVTYWHVHDNTACPIQDVAKDHEANCAETARITYNLALAVGISKNDVRYVHSESKKHYWVQIRCDGVWKDCDPSHACAQTYNVTAFGLSEPATDVQSIQEYEVA